MPKRKKKLSPVPRPKPVPGPKPVPIPSPKPKPVPKPEPIYRWEAVGTLDAATTRLGHTTNEELFLDDYIASFQASFYNLCSTTAILFGLEVPSNYEEGWLRAISRLNVFLRRDRSGSRIYRLRISYRPYSGFGGIEGGGTMDLRTMLDENGEENGPMRSIGSVTYAMEPPYTDLDFISQGFKITENYDNISEGSGTAVPFIMLSLRGFPTGTYMGGIIRFITLERRM